MIDHYHSLLSTTAKYITMPEDTSGIGHVTDSRYLSAAQRVYGSPELMRMITSHLSIGELAGLSVLEKSFLPIAMDFIGERTSFPEALRKGEREVSIAR